MRLTLNMDPVNSVGKCYSKDQMAYLK